MGEELRGKAGKLLPSSTSSGIDIVGACLLTLSWCSPSSSSIYLYSGSRLVCLIDSPLSKRTLDSSSLQLAMLHA